MAISVFDLFKVGIGPSSSHTVGPMKAAKQFVVALNEKGAIEECASLKVQLYGSLGATGGGHGTPKAIVLGLKGEDPETVNVEGIASAIEELKQSAALSLLSQHHIPFDYRNDIILHRRKSLSLHSNGMRFTAYDAEQRILLEKVFFSIGGGFIVDESDGVASLRLEAPVNLLYPFSTGKELLQQANKAGLTISRLMLANETQTIPQSMVIARLMELWRVMNDCIEKGIVSEGIMPGGLKVRRRAPQLYRQLRHRSKTDSHDSLLTLDWVTLYALAVNEENAVGGRVVTAPTNGAAGIIPAVLRYYLEFCQGAKTEDAARFLLTAAAIGILYKTNASISGAEVGCQGEVGSACSMAAAALTELMGGTLEQVENAAEIAMEHNLGLTCDPIGGLVQVPCIERNAMGAIKAISSARMALRGDGEHCVSLDQVIKTMRDTGRDMQAKYKETSRGGLAINVLEVPVSLVEC